MATRTEKRSSESSNDFEHRFRALVECSADAIFITDFNSAKFIEINPIACELFGYDREELRGMTGRQLHPAEDAAVVDEISQDLVTKGAAHRRAVRLLKKSGETFWAELRSSAYSFESRKLYVTLVRDVSAHLSREHDLQDAYRSLKETEAHLVRSSRLAAIGQLAAGVAHEVNNPAASALTNLELLKRDLSKLAASMHDSEIDVTTAISAVEHFVADATESVRDSLEAIQRIALTVKGLRGFSRIEEDDIENVDINEVVRAACNLVRHQIRHTAEVRCHLGATMTVPGSRGRLVQVVLNLLLNAAHAIEEGGGGRIEVHTLSTSDGILLRVLDDGPGVPCDIKDQIFDPFFTTKAADRGTGLGLSVCLDIVRRHSGVLRLATSTLGGAGFEALIPFHTGLRPRVSAHPPSMLPQPALRLLIVDDEVSLVRSYRRLLGRKHEVIGAYGGEEALAILAQDRAFDLILCDLMMPGTDGAAVYDAVRQKYPELLERLVFCSGGPTSARAQQLVAQPGVTLLEKPVASDTLEQFILRQAGAIVGNRVVTRSDAPVTRTDAPKDGTYITDAVEWNPGRLEHTR